MVPDLFADTTGDGQLGDGDVLYSLVDLNVYLAGIPSFSLGDSFNIVGGLVAGLPGMMFSTTPFVFDPANGFSGTPFSGLGLADAEHGLTAVPEPLTILTVGTGLAGFVVREHGRRTKRSK